MKVHDKTTLNIGFVDTVNSNLKKIVPKNEIFDISYRQYLARESEQWE